MRMSWLLVGALALSSSGCRVDRAPMDAAHAERVDEIDREYSREVADNDRRWADLEKKILEFRQFFIEVEPGTDAKPKDPVASEYLPRFEACQGTAEAPVPEDARAVCEAAIRDSFWRAFAARYYKADFDWVQQQREANPDLDIEWLATKSHNTAVQAMIDRSLAEIRQHKADFRRSLDDDRTDRVLRSEVQRDGEIEAADQRRRAAWAAAARGFSQGMSGAATSGGGGCTSDFSCGIGKKCVKQYYNTNGVCMQAVNEYGTPSYELPDLDSVGPNTPSKSSCSIGTSCPAGFRCDLGSGVCVR